MPIQKRNLLLQNTIDTLPYKAKSMRGRSPHYPERVNPSAHAAFLQRSFKEAYEQNRRLDTENVAAVRYKNGIYLEFSGQYNFDLVTKSLEDTRQGIRILNVHSQDEDLPIRATVYIPDGKETFFISKIDKYLNERTESGERCHKDLISSIESISLAMLDAFWTGKNDSIPTNAPAKCEVWIRISNTDDEIVKANFISSCRQLDIPIDNKVIIFPERMVMLVTANRETLGALIKSFGNIAEIRRAEESVCFFEKLAPSEQKEWVDELLTRVESRPTNTSICILDTGLNRGHPLIMPFCEDNSVQSVDSSWGEYDHEGHGTEMAGVALYHNLKECLESRERQVISHQIESVKLLSPRDPNAPELYGAITQNAVYLAEIAQPNKARAICMAVTEDNLHNINDGRPSSWSGAVDALVSGVEDGTKRLFFVSAGNVPINDMASGYPDINLVSSVQSPGQAWNALTIGAYASGVQISDPYFNDFIPVAPLHGLSPYSATSKTWKNKWPIKPEILCDGGNVATDGTVFSDVADLSVLTTHYQPLHRLFSTIWGTSSATAQAAWMAAQIMSEYPDLWPETVRALLVHSARWTDAMREQFCVPDQKETGRKTLLRSCGYGIPNLDYAIQCLDNHVNMIIQGTLQPFTKSKKMNEMHIHKIPWPKQVLEALSETQVEMRVTLSYFIEPGPGEIGWKDKYRYQSCGLRFDVINTDETRTDFEKRINVMMRGEDLTDSGEGSSGSANWYLGSANRDVGSIHSDFRRQNAVDICDANYIAVYPVIGWWRERTNLACYDKEIRYALVLSISAPEVVTDLYTAILSQIKIPSVIAVEVET